MSSTNVFKFTHEKDVTRAIIREYFEMFDDAVESDVVIIGAGPSGLMAGAELAGAGLKTVIIEANNYLGGGFWVGGCFFNKVTFRSPSHEIMNKLGVPLKKISEDLYVGSAPHACSALIKHACDKGVTILNLMSIEDVILKNDRVCGAVINWSSVKTLPKQITCLDPLAIESKIVIDATGHEAAAVSKLAKRNLVKIENDRPMDVSTSEEEVISKTGEVYPGMYVAGMATATVFALHRMGPTFGSMLYSGKKAASLILENEFSSKGFTMPEAQLSFAK